MAKKKRKIFRTPAERAAWEACYEASMRRLEWHCNRIKAELEAKGAFEGPPLPDFPNWRRA
jgi:hypothetical protein